MAIAALSVPLHQASGLALLSVDVQLPEPALLPFPWGHHL